MPSQIELIKKYGLSIRGNLGQHLLVDPNIARKITEQLDMNSSAGVLEIGPGLGALTALLLEAGHWIVAVEKDRRFAEILEKEFEPHLKRNLKIESGDILEKDISKIVKTFFKNKFPIQVISNLPYYITAPILLQLCSSRRWISKAVVMMQKEVADRLLAMPGVKAYGRLTLAVRYAASIKKAFDVPASCFTPRPEVDSTVLVLEFSPKAPLSAAKEKKLFQLIQLAFSQRRKTLLSLISHQSPDLSKEQIALIFDELGFSHTLRGEELLLKDFIDLSKKLDC